MGRLREGAPHSLLPLSILGVVVLLLHVGLVFSDQVSTEYDLVAYFYPLWEYRAQALRGFTLPLWNPYVYAGAPFAANIQAGVFYPLNLPLVLLDAPRAVAISYVLHLWMAGAFMFLFARVSLGLGLWASFFSGLVFMLSGFFAAQAGHINQVNAAAWLPLLFALLDLGVQRRSLKYMALGAVAMAMQLLSGHPQESYITMVALGAYALFLTVRGMWAYLVASRGASGVGEGVVAWPRILSIGPDYLRPTLAPLMGVGLIVLLGVTLAAVQLAPTWELARQSIRSGGVSFAEASSFSLPPWELGRSLLPAFKGNPFTENVAYIGFIPLGLAALALLRRPRSVHAWFFLVVMLLSLIMALGKSTPLFGWTYLHVPGIPLFRVPARWLLVYTFAGASLAGLGFDVLIKPALGNPALRSRLLVSVCVTIVLLVLWSVFYKFVGVFFTAPSSYGLWLWPLYAGASVLVIALGLALSPSRALAGLAVAICLSELTLARLDLPPYKLVAHQAYSSIRPATATLLAQDGLFRSLSMADTSYEPGDLQELRAALRRQLKKEEVDPYIILLKQREVLAPNTGMTMGLASLDGYDGGVLPLKGYQAIKGALLNGAEPPAPLDDVPLLFRLAKVPDARLLGALGVRYLIDDRLRDRWQEGFYYDLTFEREVTDAAPLTLAGMTDFQATYVGLVGHLESDFPAPYGEAVARVMVEDGSGRRVERDVRAGIDIDDASGVPGAASSNSLPGAFQRYGSSGYSYFFKVDLGPAMYPKRITVETREGFQGAVVINGATLVDSRTSISLPLDVSPDWIPVYVGDLKVYENKRWLPRVYATQDYVVASSPEEAVSLLKSGPFVRVVLERPPRDASRGDDPAAAKKDSPAGDSEVLPVEVTEYRPGSVTARATLGHDGLVVFSESYYSGWKAKVDGREVEVLRANGLFQAVWVPAGQHEVQFEYRPWSLILGALISVAGIGVTLFLLFSRR